MGKRIEVQYLEDVCQTSECNGVATDAIVTDTRTALFCEDCADYILSLVNMTTHNTEGYVTTIDNGTRIHSLYR